ncbi:hypothetical protein BC567DRAFT_11514 [Phyllosticta citribraziliensis]
MIQYNDGNLESRKVIRPVTYDNFERFSLPLSIRLPAWLPTNVWCVAAPTSRSRASAWGRPWDIRGRPREEYNYFWSLMRSGISLLLSDFLGYFNALSRYRPDRPSCGLSTSSWLLYLQIYHIFASLLGTVFCLFSLLPWRHIIPLFLRPVFLLLFTPLSTPSPTLCLSFFSRHESHA